MSCGGSVIVIEVVAEQLFASVTVKECVPALRLNVPVPVYGDAPPEAETVTVEVPPLHRIGVAVAEAISSPGAVIVMEVVVVQLLASVTVKECVPAPRLNAPVPEYGAVPPVAATVTVALPLLHSTGVALAVALSDEGSVRVIEVDAEQAL
jgi:hypothetical protein